jgi:hypothetical protein
MQLLYGVNEDIDYDEAVSLGLVEYEPPPPPPPPRGKRKGARARRPTEDRMRRPKEDR